MKISIWSDVRCPFCYIAKKKFDEALSQFEHKDEVEVTWKSYELDPELKTDPSISTLEYLASNKRMPTEQVKQMFSQAKLMGQEVGIELNLETSVPANSKNAHRLTHLANSKSREMGDQLTESLFKAHFTDAKNIDDNEVLLALGLEVGLEEKEVQDLLESDAFAYEVRQDQMEAGNTGVRGVPFFVMHKKFAVSGAQPTEAFLESLRKSWHYYKQDEQPMQIISGSTCDVDGNCE